MSRHNEYSIRQLLDIWLKQQFHIHKRILELGVMKAWPKVMGPVVAKHTGDVYIYQGTLTVRLNSAALRQELSYDKSKIIQFLNDEVGQEIVVQLVLQ